MKPYERREAGKSIYYKLATWCPISMTWRDGKVAYDNAEAALRDAVKPGRYRISAVLPTGRDDLAPFTIT